MPVFLPPGRWQGRWQKLQGGRAVGWMPLGDDAAPATPDDFSQIAQGLVAVTKTIAPVAVAVEQTQQAKAVAKSAQAAATQSAALSKLQELQAAVTKPSNIPLVLIGGGAALLVLVLLLRSRS